jgi:hypothetical protein
MPCECRHPGGPTNTGSTELFEGTGEGLASLRPADPKGPRSAAQSTTVPTDRVPNNEPNFTEPNMATHFESKPNDSGRTASVRWDSPDAGTKPRASLSHKYCNEGVAILTTKFRLALVGIALAAFSPDMVSAADFAGAWAISGVMGHSEISATAPVCVLRQLGNKVAGTCKGANGIGSAAGVVGGSKIVLRWNRIARDRLQVNGVVIYSGTWGSAGLRGTWTDSARPGVVGTFAARKVR